MTPPRAADERPDLELIAVCQRGGDEAAVAFETLYRRHSAFVLRVARRFAPDEDQALDALQETFAYLLRRVDPAGDGLVLTARLTTLLYPVAKHHALAARKRAARLEPIADEIVDPRAAADRPPHALSDPLDAALDALPPERRELLVLRFVEGLSLAEIAGALSIPVGTVKSRIHHAVRQLREDPRTRDLFED